jgi:hypothetical protein
LGRLRACSKKSADPEASLWLRYLKRVGAHSQEIGVESQDVIAASVVVSGPCEAMEVAYYPYLSLP